MAVYIIRLYADSLVRLNQKPYLEEGAARSLALNLPGVTVAVFDRFVSVGDVEVPRGLFVQVGLEASDIDEAVAKAKGVASYLLSMLCCVTLASVEQPKPIWVYDASPGAEDREYRHFAYENECAVLSTRRLEDANLFALLERNFNSFLSDAAIREDWKERVQRAIQSFRRGLADNDDVLTEFVIAWSSMEGLDCVYQKVADVHCGVGPCGVPRRSLGDYVAGTDLEALSAPLARATTMFMTLSFLGTPSGLMGAISYEFVRGTTFSPPSEAHLAEHPSFSRRRRGVSRVACHWHCDSRCVNPWAIRKRRRQREESGGYRPSLE